MTVAAFSPRTVALPGTLEPLASSWLSSLAARGYAENTIIAYKKDLERLVGFLAARDITLAQVVTPLHIEQFIDALVHGEQLSPRSASRALNGVRSFYHWLEIHGIVTPNNNPLRTDFKLRYEPRKVIAPSTASLLEMVDSIPADDPVNIRDRAFFRLMLDGGLRVSGVCGLDIFDESAPSEWHVAPTGVVFYRAKGGKTRETVVDETTLRAVQAWMDVRHRLTRKRRPTPALFLSNRGDRVTRAGMHVRIKNHGKRAGMPFVHCHLLRHSRISDALERGNLHLANYLAGHASKSTTADMYGDQPRERLRNTIRRLCSLDEVVA